MQYIINWSLVFLNLKKKIKKCLARKCRPDRCSGQPNTVKNLTEKTKKRFPMNFFLREMLKTQKRKTVIGFKMKYEGSLRGSSGKCQVICAFSGGPNFRVGAFTCYIFRKNWDFEYKNQWISKLCTISNWKVCSLSRYKVTQGDLVPITIPQFVHVWTASLQLSIKKGIQHSNHKLKQI